jgi:hypothetical protein
MALQIALAAAAAGTLLTGAVGGGKAPQATSHTTTTQTSGLQFPEETRRLFEGLEYPIASNLFAEQRSLFSPFMGGSGFRTNPALKSMYGGAPNVALAAARSGAGSAGISDLGSTFEGTSGLSPQILQGLQELVQARGAQVNAVVPPGYGQFLAPSPTSTSTQKTSEKAPGPSPFETGFRLAEGFTNIGANSKLFD